MILFEVKKTTRENCAPGVDNCYLKLRLSFNPAPGKSFNIGVFKEEQELYYIYLGKKINRQMACLIMESVPEPVTFLQLERLGFSPVGNPA